MVGTAWDRLVTRLIPYNAIPLPISAPRGDAGLFGPGSVTWRVMREPRLIVGAGRALLMQVAHPLVAAASNQRSNYATDPFGRLTRTVHWVSAVSFGTRAEAERACAQINHVHDGIRGHTPAPYSALDADLLRWVHASFVDTMLVAHDALVGGLREDDRDRFVDEWNTVGTLMRVPPGLLFGSHQQLRDYVEREAHDGAVDPTDDSRIVAECILRPPLPSAALRPLWRIGTLTMLGLLPTPIRRGYGVPWTAGHRAVHDAVCGSLRRSAPFLPRQLREAPVYQFAAARVAVNT